MSTLREKTLLVVDDEVMIREILIEVLVDAGAQVDEAENGTAALAKVRAKHYDAVISDMRMPGGNGLELITKINQEITPRPKLFLCSGFTDVTAEAARDLGIVRIFSKPFAADEIVEALNNALTN
ncbi:MAG: response regulator [Proteobacteria bacterium]|nr:response regulator [Pseudomonadota bacterium]